VLKKNPIITKRLTLEDFKNGIREIKEEIAKEPKIQISNNITNTNTDARTTNNNITDARTINNNITDARTTTNITDASTNVNIGTKLPKCFYSALVDKIGLNEIHKLLEESCSKEGLNTLTVYKKLFPSNKAVDNPIIFHDNHFKYLDDNNEIICNDDILKIIAHELQTALLYASNELINECIKTNRTTQLYDVYNISEIQGNIHDLKNMNTELEQYIKSLSS